MIFPWLQEDRTAKLEQGAASELTNFAWRKAPKLSSRCLCGRVSSRSTFSEHCVRWKVRKLGPRGLEAVQERRQGACKSKGQDNSVVASGWARAQAENERNNAKSDQENEKSKSTEKSESDLKNEKSSRRVPKNERAKSPEKSKRDRNNKKSKSQKVPKVEKSPENQKVETSKSPKTSNSQNVETSKS